MARTKKSQRQSYPAGERGRNRARVFPDPKTGIMQLEWRERGRRLTKSLKHRDWDKAKEQADQFAASYVQPTCEPVPEAEPLTLGKLFEMYLGEVTPTKSPRSQRHDKRASRLFLEFVGRDREPALWTYQIRSYYYFSIIAAEGAMSNGQDLKAKSAALEMAQEGHRLLKSGDYEGAIVACNEAIELQPGALGARRTLAEAYERSARDRDRSR